MEHFKTAEEFSVEEREIFKKIVLKAGEVSEKSFDGLMQKNPKLLFIGSSTQPSGIGALKIPNRKYKEKVFEKADSVDNADNFYYELGWVVSLNKGDGNRIVSALSECRNVYATVREDNVVMIYLLGKYGFQQLATLTNHPKEITI